MGKHAKPVACPTCNGSGKITVTSDGKNETVSCGVCKGSGKA
ncbi:hypothetical protein ThrDRAFT_03516 [Frankia casuarinae]|nr:MULTISPECIES: hypothetical protein [Frankia]ETA00002.1 hypothetical protein CcI6DRAFT_04575 [Frankia sp. CcI6]EYT90868.1 hypothetical protein ThrDRAFT_03516 [Frankia casuarinae]KDA41846.1 hypothetical protein BMG523Draft_03317 [Frankia sp. BMG5.23]KEZ35355.1 hypothetical protein CEDDRAFT_03286 [Frankia sp. CeD]OAA19996.1 hypothetical protein AAY23_10994 [Frankia casuarinae]